MAKAVAKVEENNVVAFDASMFEADAGLGMDNIARHERDLRDYAQSRFAGLNWLNVQGNSHTKGAIFSFTIEGAAHAHDISTVVDQRGIAVRAGHHCAQLVIKWLEVVATLRISFYVYNTKEDCDKFIESLHNARNFFKEMGF